ncbi:MAG TPA: carotenoid oxygenase family protein, partial [Pseudomonadales bacterium]|nr:carotenoid oxygenase family protein [Pseudomonadales bacterium]
METSTPKPVTKKKAKPAVKSFAKIQEPEILQHSHFGGFKAQNEEFDYWIDYKDVQGKVPDAVTGTFFRIGPGRNEIGGEKFGHWFDGDGMMNSVSFFPKGIRYRNKYVRTPKYKAETKAQHIVKRSFGHNAPGGILANFGRLPANCANTSLVYHAGKLLALWEGGRPWQLDPSTLDTVGEYDFNKRLHPLAAFSAHGKTSARNGCYYNFGLRPKLNGQGAIDLYKISPSGYLVQKASVDIDFMCFCHDFALTEHYAVFFISPLAMKSPLPFMAGLSTFDQALKWQPNLGMKVYVVRLSDFKLERMYFIDQPFVAIHYGNAWEENGKIIVDLTRFEDFRVNELLRNVFTLPANGAGGVLYRYTLDMVNGNVTGVPFDKAKRGEFPQWDPRRTTYPTRYIFEACMYRDDSPFFDAVQR